jgi:uncharacterized protein YktB (UPF0637 family)
MTVKIFLANRSTVNILALANILSPKVKIDIAGRLFLDVEGIKKNVTDEFNIVPPHTFDDGFVKRLKLCRKRVAVNGDYFERKQNFILFHVFLFFQTESQNFIDSVHKLLTFAHIITHCPF